MDATKLLKSHHNFETTMSEAIRRKGSDHDLTVSELRMLGDAETKDRVLGVKRR